MTNKTKHLSSILSLDEGLPFDNAILVASLLPTCKWYCRFDPRVYHDDDWVMDVLGHPKFNLLPAKDKSPKWPIGIQGSISHHHNLAVCIGWQSSRTEQSGLGIDIEKVIAPPLALKL